MVAGASDGIDWAGLVREGNDVGLPSDWPAERERLVFELRRSIAFRWQDHTARGAVLHELSEVLGEDVVDADLCEPMEAVGKKVLELYEACQRFGAFPLPEADPERLEKLRTGVHWEGIPEVEASGAPQPNTGHGWMRPEELAELDAMEARLAEELRGHREERS